MPEYRNAVEASVCRAKALGARSNLYIVEGDTYAYATGGDEDEKFRISTRSEARPTRVGELFRTEWTIETLWPRPNVGMDWAQDGELWKKNDE